MGQYRHVQVIHVVLYAVLVPMPADAGVHTVAIGAGGVKIVGVDLPLVQKQEEGVSLGRNCDPLSRVAPKKVADLLPTLESLVGCQLHPIPSFVMDHAPPCVT